MPSKRLAPAAAGASPRSSSPPLGIPRGVRRRRPTQATAQPWHAEGSRCRLPHVGEQEPSPSAYPIQRGREACISSGSDWCIPTDPRNSKIGTPTTSTLQSSRFDKDKSGLGCWVRAMRSQQLPPKQRGLVVQKVVYCYHCYPENDCTATDLNSVSEDALSVLPKPRPSLCSQPKPTMSGKGSTERPARHAR